MKCMHKVNVSKNKNIGSRIVSSILITTVILAIVGLPFVLKKNKKQPEDYFVKYDNATTLVRIKYGEASIWGYEVAIGFIDDDIYEKYKNHEYEGKIEVYHPYTKGNSTTVDTNKIVSVETKTYNSFYRTYSPHIYE